jgi:hypothetical protein
MDFAVAVVRSVIVFSVRVLRRIWPFVLHLAIFTLWAMLYSMAAVWIGWPTASERITQEWMRRAALAGVPSPLDPYLYYFMRTGAYALLVFGWICLSYLTTGTIHLLLSLWWYWARVFYLVFFGH